MGETVERRIWCSAPRSSLVRLQVADDVHRGAHRDARDLADPRLELVVTRHLKEDLFRVDVHIHQGVGNNLGLHTRIACSIGGVLCSGFKLLAVVGAAHVGLHTWTARPATTKLQASCRQ